MNSFHGPSIGLTVNVRRAFANPLLCCCSIYACSRKHWFAGEKRDQAALSRVNLCGLGTVDVGLRTQPRTQKGTNHKKRLYVWKLNTPGRSRMVENTDKI